MDDAQPLRITLAAPADLELLHALAIETFTETWAHHNTPEDMAAYLSETYAIDRLTRELTDPRQSYWLAWLDGQSVGYAKLRTTELPDGLAAQNPIELEKLYVRSAYYGRKVGAGLMAHCLSYARQQGHDVCWLGVWEHNARALPFYKSWGFTVFGSHVFELGQARDVDLLMQLAL